MILVEIRVRIGSLLRYHIEMRYRHDDHFVRLRNDSKGITSLMNHQVQHVMDDCTRNAQDDWNRTDKKTQRANGDTHQHGVQWCVVRGAWCVVCGVLCVEWRRKREEGGRVREEGEWCVLCSVFCVLCSVFCVLCSVSCEL